MRAREKERERVSESLRESLRKSLRDTHERTKKSNGPQFGRHSGLQPCVVRLGPLVAQHQHTTPSPVDVVGRGTVLLAPYKKHHEGKWPPYPE